jgi:peptidoglycan/xylan/chitin deacetylase (PgdA/CDA1 family)
MPYTLSRREFAGHLKAIQRRSEDSRVAIVSMDSSPGTRDILITFDDGAAGGYQCAAPELEKLGWRGHFFVVTDWIGREGYFSRNDIVDLHNRGHVIGSHTCSHPERMSQLNWGELMREWGVSCSVLSDILGVPITTASVANGYSSRQVELTAEACGIRHLFTSKPTARIVVRGGIQVLGRYSIQATTPAEVAAAIAAGAVLPRLKQAAFWTIKDAVKSVAGSNYLALRARLLSEPSRGSFSGTGKFPNCK